MTRAAGATRPGRSLAAFVLGLVLLALALWVLGGQRELLAGAIRSAQDAPWWALAGLVVLPLGNWCFSTLVFWVLMRRVSRVGVWEMGALLGGAWLANMLPLKPGLVGRIAYHRIIGGVPVSVSLGVTLVAMLSGAVMIALTLALCILAGVRPPGTGPELAVMILVAGAALGVPVIVLSVQRYRAREPILDGWGAFVLAVVLRGPDTLIWALRAQLAFLVIGQPQTLGVCLVVACLSQIAGQTPAQLGAREWAVGATSGVLHAGRAGLSAAGVGPGLAAELVNRAAEIAVALPVGLVSMIWVARRIRRVDARASGAGMIVDQRPN